MDLKNNKFLEKYLMSGYLKKFSLILISVLIILYIIFQLIYPTMICKGSFNKNRVWTSSYNKAITKVLDDEHLEVSWSLLFRRGAIVINEDRFPLYKELNQTNHFAQATTVGYSGSYSVDFLRHIKYQFTYNEISSQLAVELIGKGNHILEGEVGLDDLKATFIGNCQRKWF